MNTNSTPHRISLARIVLSLLAILVISACGTQAPTTAPLPAPTQTASPAIPITGPATSTVAATVPAPTAAPATAGPTAAAPLPTQTAVPAAVTQPAASAPDCKSPAALTPAQTEGPYFKANSPERTSLIEPGVSGNQLVLTGYVLTADCKPVAGALLDFWQADANGQYDNRGYTLRGHQFTDAQGRYQLITVVPGLYTGRTEHIHVKVGLPAPEGVAAPNGPVLTTQLYFPDVQAANQRDGIYNPALLVKLEANGNPQQASFNFIVRVP